MPPAAHVARIDHEASQWDQAFYAFLSENERRSGSIRTRGMTADEILRLLAVVPTRRTGLRDRAIIQTLVFTAQRRAEAMRLRVQDLVWEGESALRTPDDYPQ